MNNYLKGKTAYIVAVIMVVAALAAPQAALASKAEDMDREARDALQELYKSSPAAAELAKVAKAILVFPRMVKAGFVVGGQYGEGALLQGDKTLGYYNSVSGSYGLQIGAQKFGYALFFMTDDAVEYLKKSEGWEIGVGPSVVVVDAGVARSLTTTTAKDSIYAFFFGQKGLMAGLGVQGTKITPIKLED